VLRFAAVTSCEQPTAFIEAERVNAWLRPDKTNKPAVYSDYERRPQISKPLNALTSFPAAQARISLITLKGSPQFSLSGAVKALVDVSPTGRPS
jgi:hypothetical protein